MTGAGHRLGRCKECSDEIIDRQLHVGIGWRERRFFRSVGAPYEIEEQASGSRAGAPVNSSLRLESEMGNQRFARQAQRNGVPWLTTGGGAICHGPGRV